MDRTWPRIPREHEDPIEAAMNLSKVEIAALNSTRWYEAMFAAHGLRGETDGRVWLSHETPPPFHSNLVVLAPATTRADIEAYAAEIERRRHTGWSLKDSFACLDLDSLGCSLLFEADWIWRDPGRAPAPGFTPGLSWVRLTTPSSLEDWEQAWSGDTRNDAVPLRTRQFPASLLDSPDHAFFAGLSEGRVLAGGIALRSPGAVGLSNVFSPPELLEHTWSALVSLVAAAFPGTPIVGYERGDDLEIARGAGFAPVGKLRVWCWRA
jgi:hypothetical protein